MPYLRKGNPYNAGYAVPRYVVEERERRVRFPPRAPRRTIGAAQAPPTVTPYTRRRTVSMIPPPDFTRQTGRIYPANALAFGSLGSADGFGVLGCGPGCRCMQCRSTSLSGTTSLGEECPPDAPPGSTCIARTDSTGMRTRTVESSSSSSMLAGQPPSGVSRDGFDQSGRFVGYTAIGLDAQDKRDYDSALAKASAGMLPWAQGMNGNIAYANVKAGNLDFRRYRANGKLISRFYDGRRLRVAATGPGIGDWAGDVLSWVAGKVRDVLDEIRKLGCKVAESDVTALVEKSGPGAKASDLARRLCGGGGGGGGEVFPSGGGTPWLLIGGAAAAAWFLTRKK